MTTAMTPTPSYPPSVLITGGSGFVGSHLLSALSKVAPETRCIATSRHPEMISSPLRECAEWVSLDLDDDEVNFGSLSQVSTLVHVASSDAEADLASATRLNVDGTAHLMAWAKAHGVQHVIFISTGSVYAVGEDPEGSFSETASLCVLPATPYAISKRKAEEVVLASKEIPFLTILRPSFVYGTEEEGYIGGLVESIQSGEPFDLALPNGHLITPTHVADVVDVILRSIASPRSETLNVCGRERFAQADLARSIAAHLYEPLAFSHTNGRSLNYTLSCARLDARFPDRKHTDWKEGLRSSWPF